MGKETGNSVAKPSETCGKPIGKTRETAENLQETHRNLWETIRNQNLPKRKERRKLKSSTTWEVVEGGDGRGREGKAVQTDRQKEDPETDGDAGAGPLGRPSLRYCSGPCAGSGYLSDASF